MIPKPYLIIAVLIAFIGIFSAGYIGGHKAGTNAQKVADQVAVDKQKAEADAIIQENIDSVLATQAENDEFKNTIEKERQTHVKETNNLRSQLATTSLRFKSDSSGACGIDKVSDPASASSNTSAAFVELPSEIATNLRQLAFDCDTLKDDYEVLYKFTNGVK